MSEKKEQIKELDALQVLSSMDIIESDCDGGELLYVLVENSEENVELLKSIRATEEDLKNMQGDEESEVLEISVFAFEKAGADVWSRKEGFMTKEQYDELVKTENKEKKTVV